MFRRYFCQLAFMLLCCCLLITPAFRQRLSAHAFFSRQSAQHFPSSVPEISANPIADVSIQALNNVWYTGNGIDSTNYLLLRRWNGSAFQDPLHTIPYQPYQAGQAVLALSSTLSWTIANGLTAQNPLDIIRFTGAGRSTFASPSIHGEVVNAMAAVNANDIWAVGSSGPLVNTFIMHWDGTRWQHIGSPNVPNKYNSLWGVSARTTNDIWAVGSQQGIDGGDTPLIMHWNGKTWAITPNPPIVDLPDHALNAVIALASNNVWTVGLGGLIEHWNGASWQIISFPIAVPSYLSLNAISATAANNIWTVGQLITCPTGKSCSASTFSEHWDGHTWQVIPTPSLVLPGIPPNNILISVRMFSAIDGLAFGKSDDTIFFERWNGAAWHITTQHNVYF